MEDGSQCGAYSIKGKTLCFSHDPESAEAKAVAVKNGGSSKEIRVDTSLEPIEMNGAGDVVKLLIKTINEVREGKLDPRVANTIGYLSSHLLKAYEVASLDTKLTEITAIFATRQTPSRRICNEEY